MKNKGKIIGNTKYCTKCKEYLDFSHFSKKRTGVNGLNSVCRLCNKKRIDIYYKEENNKIKEKDRVRNNRVTENGLTSARERKIKVQYNISGEEYAQMIKDQSNLCAICNKPETAGSRYGGIRALAIDHHHESGRVRGLLCNKCNSAIGLLYEDTELFRKAIEYLTKN